MQGPSNSGPQPDVYPVKYSKNAPVKSCTDDEEIAPSTVHDDSDREEKRSPPVRNLVDESSKCTAPKYFFNCYYTNANRLLNKFNEFQAEVELWKPKVIGITESWCDDKILDSEIQLKDYTLYREDKKSAQGGGVLLYTQ